MLSGKTSNTVALELKTQMFEDKRTYNSIGDENDAKIFPIYSGAQPIFKTKYLCLTELT